MKHPDPMNPTRKAIIWQRWKAGSSMAEISRAIAKPPATVFSYLWYHGGIEPHRRSRSVAALSFCERETISRGLASGESMRTIAALLGRSPSTISREVNRNGGPRRYRAIDADKVAWKRAKRPIPLLLTGNSELKKLVASKLSEDWSPEQISGWLKIEFPDDEGLCVTRNHISKHFHSDKRFISRGDA